MSESYATIEARIQAAYSALCSETKPNIAAAARAHAVPESRLRSRWKGRLARNTRDATGKKLTDDQERALCRWLDGLDGIGAGASLSMLVTAANAVLARAPRRPGQSQTRSQQEAEEDREDGSGRTTTTTATAAPTVGDHWARRFVQRHRQYALVRKQLEQGRFAVRIVRRHPLEPDDLVEE